MRAPQMAATLPIVAMPPFLLAPKREVLVKAAEAGAAACQRIASHVKALRNFLFASAQGILARGRAAHVAHVHGAVINLFKPTGTVRQLHSLERHEFKCKSPFSSGSP